VIVTDYQLDPSGRGKTKLTWRSRESTIDESYISELGFELESRYWPVSSLMELMVLIWAQWVLMRRRKRQMIDDLIGYIRDEMWGNVIRRKRRKEWRKRNEIVFLSTKSVPFDDILYSQLQLELWFAPSRSKQLKEWIVDNEEGVLYNGDTWELKR